MHFHPSIIGPLLATAMLTGCVGLDGIGGDPSVFLATAPDAPAQWAAAGVSGTVTGGDWLAQFGDPQMTALVSEALAANPGLSARAASVRAAKAQARATYGANRPQVSASASAGATSSAFEFAGDLDRSTDAVFGLGLDASWEADLWGRLSAGEQAADADIAASEADFAAARLSLAANTASAWVDLNARLDLERVAVLTYEARVRVEELTERRFARGLSTALDVRTARSAVAGAEASISAQRQSSGEAARRLEILLGRYPSAELKAPAELPKLPPIEITGNPVLLLSRRPDIASAEAQIRAAGLRTEQARLALLPSLRLTGSLSTSETDLIDAVDPRRIAARAIAGLAMPILNGGQLQARRDIAVAQAEIAVANYATSALSAWREVEDAIAADTLLAQQEDAQRRALEEAVFAEDLAERQYSGGLVSVFNLIDTQTRRLNAESNLVSVRAQRAFNRINYHLALGGGLPASADASSLLVEGANSAGSQ